MSFPNRLFGRKRKPDPQELLDTILTFIQAETWSDSHCIIEQHPELLTDHSNIKTGCFQGLLP